MKKILTTLAISLAIPFAVLASPVSVDRLNNNHIEPLTKTDYVKANYFIATGTTPSVLPNASTTALSVSGYFNFLGTSITNVATWFSGLFDSNFSGKTTANLTENTNLYYTPARVNALINASTTIPTGTPTNGYVFVGNGTNWSPMATATLGISGTVSGGTAGMLTAWTSSSGLTATGTPTVAAINASSTTATSTFKGNVKIEGLLDATSILFNPTFDYITTLDPSATSSFAGNITVAGNASTTSFFGANLQPCNGASNALTWIAGKFICSTISTGGGSGGGSWSTTTSPVSGRLVNYSNNVTDIVAIGSNSTTTAEFYFDPNLPRSYLSGTTTLAGDVIVGTGAIDAFTIDYNGNVGIGTTSPATALSVVGTTTVSQGLTVGSGTTTQAFCIGTDGKMFTWNGSNYTSISFAANSITPVYATSTQTTCL